MRARIEGGKRGCAAVLMLLLGLCATSGSAGDLPRTRVEAVRPGTGAVLLAVSAEVAQTPETRTRGLMERSVLPRDRGMLFLFEEPQVLHFWMFNTFIPLDIIFADARRHIIRIHPAVPPCLPPRRCPTYASDGPAQFVLEVNGGVAASAGLRVGDALRWSPP
jgi:uncharacterized membrane protein (UPF0127 family)